MKTVSKQRDQIASGLNSVPHRQKPRQAYGAEIMLAFIMLTSYVNDLRRCKAYSYQHSTGPHCAVLDVFGHFCFSSVYKLMSESASTACLLDCLKYSFFVNLGKSQSIIILNMA